MLLSDVKENLFKEQFENSYKPLLKELRQYISMQTDVFKINEIAIDIDDILKRQDDINYMSDLGITYDKGEINVLIFNKEFYYDTRDYIPKTITKLEVPCDFIDYDIDFLKTFTNLSTLKITDYANLTEEQIIFLSKNTSIKEINSHCIYNYNDYYKTEGFSYCSSSKKFLSYKDLIIQSDEMTSSDYMEINLHDITLIENIFKYNGNKIKKTTKIKLNDGSFIDIYLKEDNIIDNIKVETNNTNNITYIFDFLTKKGYKIEKITYDIKDKTYYDKDFSSLESVASNTNLYIKYGPTDYAIYDEFAGLQETIKWTTQIINGTNLSPVEKLMFAFDFMKTFKYNESLNEKMDSREPHRILETGNIVCVGYSRFLQEIVENLNIGIKIGDVGVNCYDKNGNNRGGHARNIVKIDDDKYNINGIFILDSTWDSVKHNNIPTDYNALDLYRYFLVPAEDYKNIFPYDTIPTLFKLHLNEKLEDYEKPFSEDTSLYQHALENSLKEKMEDEEIKKYLSVSRPSLAQFKEILYNVRLAEGYSKEEAMKDVEKVVRFNVNVINTNNENGMNMTFFEEKKTK